MRLRRSQVLAVSLAGVGFLLLALFLVVRFGNPQWNRYIYIYQAYCVEHEGARNHQTCFGVSGTVRYFRSEITVPERYTGTWRTWDVDGNLVSSVDLKNGMADGRYVSWYDTGQLQSEEFYANGLPAATSTWRRWDEFGNLRERKKYRRHPQFKIVDLLELSSSYARPLLFLPKARHLFIGHGKCHADGRLTISALWQLNVDSAKAEFSCLLPEDYRDVINATSSNGTNILLRTKKGVLKIDSGIQGVTITTIHQAASHVPVVLPGSDDSGEISESAASARAYGVLGYFPFFHLLGEGKYAVGITSSPRDIVVFCRDHTGGLPREIHRQGLPFNWSWFAFDPAEDRVLIMEFPPSSGSRLRAFAMGTTPGS